MNYKLIQWPESQQLIETAIREGWEKECFLAQSANTAQDWLGSSAYFVPVNRVESLQKVSRENIGTRLLENLIAIKGKSKVDILDDDMWRFNWTITNEEYLKFKSESISLLKKVFKFNNSKAISTFEWFYHNFGLRVKKSR